MTTTQTANRADFLSQNVAASASTLPTGPEPDTGAITGPTHTAAPDLQIEPIDNLLADGRELSTRDQQTTDLDFGLLYRADNVRSKATEQIPRMVASFLRHGFKRNHAIVVSMKQDGRALVLCGNRRTMAAEFLATAQPADFAKIFPNGKIPCIVHTGLTAAQESLIRIDHGTDEDRVPLDEAGEFLAVRQLLRSGYTTEVGIAEKLGKYYTSGKNMGQPNRSWVQPRASLAQMPDYVQAEFLKLWENGKESTPVRVAMIPKLYKPFNEEFARHPDGNGPQFQAVWRQFMGAVAAAAPVVKPEVITPAKALERAKIVGSRNLRSALMLVAGQGQPGETIADVDNACIVAELATVTLAEIADYLGEQAYAKLIQDSRAAAESKQAAAAPVAAAPPAPVAAAAPTAQIAESKQPATKKGGKK